MTSATDTSTWFVSSDDEGWVATPEDGRFAVRYRTNERMRIGSDGSLSLGDAEPYWFSTREWAELCAKRLNSLERAFGRGSAPIYWRATGGVGIAQDAATFRIQIATNSRPILSIDQHGKVTHFDLPAFFMAWWRNTTAYRVWRMLMWGESA